VSPTEVRVILDDRLLIEHLLVGLDGRVANGDIHTTSLWYNRACRAAVIGAGGHLSGPFTKLAEPHQNAAIRSLLTLPEHVGLPDPRFTVPLMAELSERHPRLNVINLEAVASGLALDATMALSTETAHGILPQVLAAEDVAWSIVELD